jgi:outer membrane lipoprotein carrier protein
MRLKDNLGQTTRLTFDAVKRNGPLAPGVFKFTPPAGVDVVEGGAP